MDEGPRFREVVPAQEASDVQALIARMRHLVLARDKGAAVHKRDVHIKMHGLVRAEFTVPDKLPPEVRVGLFARPGTYKAWVRYSNAASYADADIARDIRGMAIKVMGVPGKKVLESQADADTQDFMVVSAFNFPARNAVEIDALVANVVQGKLWTKLLFLITHLSAAWVLFTTMIKHANVLHIRYCSVVPYLFGSHAVKYVATPRVAEADALPSNPSRDFLRDRLVEQLGQGDAVFDFAVQFQRDQACMPLDDPFRVWSLDLSPPRKVATLRILKQSFDTESIRTYGENLSFTPWHCLPEHRPLGALNRARKAVYDTMSAFRHEANQVPRREPVDWDL